MARRLVPSRPFPTHLRRPILFRLAGKEWGEKGRLVTVWCVLRVQFRQAPMLKSLRTHIVTLQTLLYAPPVTELRICEQLPLNGCNKSALHSKFVKQYGFAGASQSLPLPRPARQGEVAFGPANDGGDSLQISECPVICSARIPSGPSGHFPLIGGISPLDPRGAFGIC